MTLNTITIAANAREKRCRGLSVRQRRSAFGHVANGGRESVQTSCGNADQLMAERAPAIPNTKTARRPQTCNCCGNACVDGKCSMTNVLYHLLISSLKRKTCGGKERVRHQRRTGKLARRRLGFIHAGVEIRQGIAADSLEGRCPLCWQPRRSTTMSHWNRELQPDMIWCFQRLKLSA